MNHLIPAATLALSALLSVPHARSEETTYRGFCDASAAVALDAKHFVVANDDRHALTVYQLGNPKAIACVGLIKGGNECQVKPGTKTDIEGAARIGNRIYWISSHAGKKAEQQQFLVTDVLQRDAGPTVTAVTPAKLDQLGFSAALNKIIKQAVDREKWGGLNIEGLAASTREQLLIGFRNPLDAAGNALLLQLDNPSEVFDKGAVPAFGLLHRIDLDGRAIRSIERVGSQLVIVAGPPEGKGKDKGFALYILPEQALAGEGVITPSRYSADYFGKRVPPQGDMHPEAVFATGRDNEVYILSDDGKKCKDAHGEKSFRGFALTLPAPNPNR